MADQTQATLNGLFKEIYADQINNLLPPSSYITKKVGFSRMDKTGNQYHQPVILTRPNGFTYGGQGTSSTAFTLNAGAPLQMKDAVISGAEFVDQETIAYGVMSRAENGDRASFMDATSLIIEQMMDSMTYRLELSCLYGGSGLAVCASRTTVDSTNTTITLTVASSTQGIWSGAEGAILNFYNGSTIVGTSAADQDYTLNGVTFAESSGSIQITLAVSATSTGITDLNTAVNSNPNVITVWFKGQKGNEFSGVDQISQLGLSAGPSSLYGITSSSYNLWRGNTYDASSAALTMGKLLAAAGRLAGRGLRAPVCVYTNPLTWQNLNADLAALRRFDSAGGEQDAGAENIVYYGPTGKMEVEANIFVKQGDAFIMADPSRAEYWKRIGSSDITFNLPGRSDEFFFNEPTKAGYSLREYCDMAIFSPVPAKSGKIINIVNT